MRKKLALGNESQDLLDRCLRFFLIEKPPSLTKLLNSFESSIDLHSWSLEYFYLQTVLKITLSFLLNIFLIWFHFKDLRDLFPCFLHKFSSCCFFIFTTKSLENEMQIFKLLVRLQGLFITLMSVVVAQWSFADAEFSESSRDIRSFR